jgi:hypothetical protein
MLPPLVSHHEDTVHGANVTVELDDLDDLGFNRAIGIDCCRRGPAS